MKTLKALGHILFWLTLISPMVGFSLSAMLGEATIFDYLGIVRYVWIMFLFIPISLLSFYVGKLLKNRGQKYKKNIIIACVCLPLMIIMGSYGLNLDNSVSYSPEKMVILEGKIDTKLPHQVKIATTQLDTYDLSYLKITDGSDAMDFERQLGKNANWTTKLDSKIKALLPENIQYELVSFDYFLFFDTSTKQYNNYPLDGEHNCVFLAYDRNLQRFIILDNLKITID